MERHKQSLGEAQPSWPILPPVATALSQAWHCVNLKPKLNPKIQPDLQLLRAHQSFFWGEGGAAHQTETLARKKWPYNSDALIKLRSQRLQFMFSVSKRKQKKKQIPQVSS